MMNRVEYERKLPQSIARQYSWNGSEHCDVAVKFRACVLKLLGSNLGRDIGCPDRNVS
jgi:hypothetical protein